MTMLFKISITGPTLLPGYPLRPSTDCRDPRASHGLSSSNLNPSNVLSWQRTSHPVGCCYRTIRQCSDYTPWACRNTSDYVGRYRASAMGFNGMGESWSAQPVPFNRPNKIGLAVTEDHPGTFSVAPVNSWPSCHRARTPHLLKIDSR